MQKHKSGLEGTPIFEQLIMKRVVLQCIDASGCGALFPESEIRRFLDQKSYEMLGKLRTEIELREVYSFCNRT